MFSVTTLNIHEDIEFKLMDDILVDEKTASFIKNYHFRWIQSKEQVHGIKIDADRDTCKDFLQRHLTVDSKVFLKDE